MAANPKALCGYSDITTLHLALQNHATVPIGARATLDADAGRLVVDEVVTAD
jgi:muramoyltetrapeptide carboxypeptidase LdcA involved in peptidoglycan recycling